MKTTVLTKSAALLLCAVMLLSTALISCGEAKNPAENTTAPTSDAAVNTSAAPETTTEPPVTEETLDLPAKKWDGRKFRVLGYSGLAQFSSFEIDAEGETGSVVNDAIWRRNTKIEDTYDVEIVQTLDSSQSNGKNATTPVVKKMVQADENNYDLVFLPIATCGSVVRGNMLYDLTKVDYINMDKSWWNQTVREDLTVSGKLFLAASDFSLRDKNRAYILCYNRDMIDEFKLEQPLPLVREGKWTIDVFNSYATKVSADLNANAEIDDMDRFGVAFDSSNAFMAMLTGAGVQIVNNTDGKLSLVVNNERTVTAIDKLLEVVQYKNIVSINPEWKGKVSYDHNTVGSKMFKEGHVLFTTTFPHALERYSAECVDAYGVIPFPKLNETQENYHTYGDIYCMLFGIPVTTPTSDFSGFMLEALSYESTKTSLHAYYEVTCKLRGMYDPDSAEMLDLIFDTLRFEPAMMYSLSGNSFLAAISSTKVNNFASEYAAKREAMEADLVKLIADIEAAG